LTVKRTARVSPYHRDLLAERGIDPAAVTTQTIENLPLTRKSDLLNRTADFIADGSRPFLSTRSTGTTGQPVTIWMSRYEAELWPALGALAGLLRGEIAEGDSMQVNVSSRATAAVQQNVNVCRLAGATCHVLGLIPAAESVRNLAGPFPSTLLATYPSYLAEMVEAARRMRLGPGDFRLRRIDCGGEVLSTHLAAAAMQTFGASVTDVFAMTEVLPVSGRTCSHGHLHHDLNTGFVEVVDPATGLGVRPGELGSVTITPYFPYRECMPLLRYETRDMVRQLAEDDVTCELAGMPATSAILGKADHLVLPQGRPVTPREIVEVLDGLAPVTGPARFQLEPRASVPGVVRRFVERGVAVFQVACAARHPQMPHAPAGLRRLAGRRADARRPPDPLRHSPLQRMPERAAFWPVIEQRYAHEMIMPSRACPTPVGRTASAATLPVSRAC
jgi:phenylacetate-CoA ligase